MDENAYVGIQDPVNVRRNLLEAEREVLHDLQIYEDISELKKKRNELQEELDSEIVQMLKILNKLKDVLPAVAKKKDKKKASKLERELSDVEKELGSL